jgi:hypothetical protein
MEEDEVIPHQSVVDSSIIKEILHFSEYDTRLMLLMVQTILKDNVD